MKNDEVREGTKQKYFCEAMLKKTGNMGHFKLPCRNFGGGKRLRKKENGHPVLGPGEGERHLKRKKNVAGN